MGRPEIATLEGLVERRVREEEELGGELAAAGAALEEARAQEARARAAARERADALGRCDQAMAAELEAGASAGELSGRAAFRARLLADLARASHAVGGAEARRAETDRARRAAQQALAAAGARRLAAEGALAQARAAEQRRLEERRDEEAADLAAARHVLEEEQQ